VTGRADRGKEMALIGAAFGVGFTFGPAMGGLSHGWWGPRAPGLLAAGFSLVAFLLAWRALPEPLQHRPPKGHRLPGAAALRHAAGHPVVLLVILLQVLATFCFANLEGTLALFSEREWGFDILQNGFLFTDLGVCLLVAQGFVVRRLMPRVGERRFAIAGALLLAAGLAGIALGGRLPVMAVAVLGFSMLTPSLASLLSLHTPAHMQGEVLGLGQSGLALARILGPWAGNLLFFGVSPRTPYWVAAAVMAAAAVASLALRPAEPAP
jgi:predicted MFS family arabinose efflux permease